MHNKRKVLAVASGGGHWEQLMLLRPSFAGFDTHFAITQPTLAERDGIAGVHVIPDANRNAKGAIFHCIWSALKLVAKLRPDVVVTTGALPGFIVLVAGRLMGARTIWVDSLANSEKLSMSGKWAARIASVTLTQWEHLAQPGGPRYEGAVL